MSEKIDETLKKIAGDIQAGKTPTEEQAVDWTPGHDLPGDPDCPQCHGVGYLRLDLPVGHPDFGKLQVCSCRSGQINLQVRQRLYALSNLSELKHLTFENFNPRGRVGLWSSQADSLEHAYNHSRQYAERLNGWLVLLGEYGCGKTHLAAAIANFAVGLGVPTLFITVPDLLDSLRFSYQGGEISFEDRFEEIRNAGLLVMDDFGTQNATGWAREKLFQIINFRYTNRLPTVVTSNLVLGDIDGRIRSRLEDPELTTIFRILAPDYRRPAAEFGHHELSSLELLNNRTFASFDPRTSEDIPPRDLDSLDKAFRAAQAFARRPQGWIVFSGPYGCGKTHLAAAIANERAQSGYPPLFIVVPDLLDHLRATFAPSSQVTLDRRFDEVRTSPLLVLDDLGTQSTTPWAREKLYQLFNFRYNAELPTVITTASLPEETDSRLLSRMEDARLCSIHAITVPAYRGGGKSGHRKRGTARSRP